MQQDNEKISIFNKAVGEIVKELRGKNSINNFAREFDFDRGNLSKFERGLLNCRLATAWKLAEASGVKFSDFAKLLEEKLGEDFTLLDL